MKTLSELDCAGKRILMRVGFDVPLIDGCVADDTRIKASLPSIKHVLAQGGSLCLMTHMGRPKELIKAGQSRESVFVRLSTKVLISSLADLLSGSGISRDDFAFIDDYFGGKYAKETLPPKRIILLENLRFASGENSEDENVRLQFASVLKVFGDMFVNDDFGIPERRNASVYEIAKIMDSYVGFLLLKEARVLYSLLESPVRPFIAVLGGAKIDEKVKVIQTLPADEIIIVGAMKYAFDKARGRQIGASLCMGADVAASLLAGPKRNSIFVVAQDVVVRKLEGRFDYSSLRLVNGLDPIGDDEAGLDIGIESLNVIADKLSRAKTIFWNGNAGLSEDEHFRATYKLVDLLAVLSRLGVRVVIGGGDSVGAIRASGHDVSEFFHVSTGGGASLAVLSGERLPALDVIGFY